MEVLFVPKMHLETLALLYKGMSESIQKTNEMYDYWPCKKGCFECCTYSPVIVTGIEWLLITEFLKDLSLDKQYKILQKYSDIYCDILNNMPKEFLSKKAGYRKVKREKMRYIKKLKNVSCPFLEEDKSCLIYTARPFACRLFGYSFKSRNLWACRKISDLCQGIQLELHDADISNKILEAINYGVLAQEPIFIWLYFFNDGYRFCDIHGIRDELLTNFRDDTQHLAFRLNSLAKRGLSQFYQHNKNE